MAGSPIFSVNVTNRKNSAVLNYHKSWSWSNQPVLWDFYIMFLLVSSLWMFVTIFYPKHGMTGDVWRHSILTFHAASVENRREKSLRVSSLLELKYTSTLSCRRLIRWNKKALLYKVILTLRWCIENNNIKFSVIVDCEIYWEYRTASHLLFWNPWPVTGHIATVKNFTRKLRYKLKKITLSLHGLHSLQSAVHSLHGLRFSSFLNPNH